MLILETHALSVGYTAARKPDIIVAKALDLTLRGGELVCLLGPNGAGKSTLMRTIAGMQPPLAGQITLSGESITTLHPRQLAKRLSVVLTDRPNVGLLNGYALVALGRHPYTDWTGRLSRYDEAVVRWAVEAVGATDLADRPVMELSDGQRQKLLVARALAQESELMLLDEPTAFLDLPRRAEIMRLLRHLATETGRAILLSMHDLDLALRSADMLWLMSGGQVRVGTPEDLVLSGAFEQAFHSDGVMFDRSTGAFRVERDRNRTIAVSGAGIPHIWTRRALKRVGFTVQDIPTPPSENNSPPPLTVIVSGTDTQPTWYVRRRNHPPTRHRSIQDLLTDLQQSS